MIFDPPPPLPEEEEALAQIAALRDDLRWHTAETRKWLGGLRRLSLARAVQGSNTIEGYDAPLDDVVAAVEGAEPIDADTETRLALEGYRDAMTYVLELSEDDHLAIDTTLLRSLHYMMIKHDLAKRPGRWRKGAIYVRRDPEGVPVYEGPDVELVPPLMEELVGAIDAWSGSDIVRAAMAHLNLAMIHPFADGNGRMARCLQTLVLTRSKEVRSAPVFCSIEEWLGGHTEEYYAVLDAVGQGRWRPERNARPWVRFCLVAHHQQALTLQWRIRAAEDLWDRCERLTAARGVPARATAPLCDASRGMRMRNASYRAAVRDSSGEEITNAVAGSDLRALVRAGLLDAVGETRGRHYVGSDLLRGQYREMVGSLPKPSMPDLFPPSPTQLGLGLGDEA